MNKTSKTKAKPLPPLMAKAFANLADALDMSKPANLGGKCPFFIKGVDDRPPKGVSGSPGALSAVISAVNVEVEGLGLERGKTAHRLNLAGLAKMRLDIKALAAETPRGATGLADAWGISDGTLRPFLNGRNKGYPATIIAAWLAFKGSPLCKTCGQSIAVPHCTAAAPDPIDTAPNPANLDRMGKRYVLAGCMVELPDLAMAKVGRVDNGRWYLPTDTEPHHATCNQVRVLMRTYSESMGAFYWA